MYFYKVIGTDKRPYETTRVINEGHLQVREMKATKGDWEMEWHKGGFAGHVANQDEQKWIIESDEQGYSTFIILSDTGWHDALGFRYVMTEQPVKFYDYNF